MQDDLTATSFVTSRLVTLVMVLAGCFFAFRPDWLGWSAMVEAVGGEPRLLATGLGCAFFLLAALSFEKNGLRVLIAELFEALNQLLYGKHYRREREAIDTLIDALEAGGETAEKAYPHLKRLTGQNFASDPGVWRAWWQANRKLFEFRRGSVPAAGASKTDDETPEKEEPPRP